MDFKQLESFQAVVRYKSFTKAAQALYISQPTISAHVRALEEELCSRLIVRTTKSIEITARGWELFECASNILKLRDHLVQSWNGEAKKMISLGVSTIPSAYILPEILPRFGERFPDVYFSVEQSDSGGILEAMGNGAYDVALVGMECRREGLACIPFYRDRIVAVTPVKEEFLALRRAEEGERLERLLKYPVILREEGSGSKKSAGVFLESCGIREDGLLVAARINDQEAIKNLVAGGLGISFISWRAAKNFVQEKRLLAFELPGEAAGRYLYVAYHKDYILKPYVRAFIEFVQGYGFEE